MADPNELKNLYNEIRELTQDSAEYTAFLEALSKAEETISSLHVKNSKGVLPLVTAEKREQLLKQHKSIGREAANMIGKETDPVILEKVRKIAALASANHRMLSEYMPDHYDPKTLKTLPTLLEDARTVTVDTRGAQLQGKVGGLNSSRQPLTFRDSRGKIVTGVFTPKKERNNWEYINTKMNEIADKCPTEEGANMVRTFLSKRLDSVKEKYPKADLVTQKEWVFEQCVKKETELVDPVRLSEVFAETFPQELAGKKISSVIGEDNYNELLDEMNEAFTGYNQNVHHAKIPDGSRIDNRNSAMSAVADLLGMPGVIARARPMKIIDENGNVIEGTFMTEAKGEDVNNLTEKAKNYGPHSLQGMSGKAFHDIADLQVLDFICANMDRHPGNLFYQFNENNKFDGAQGIDDDMSFGNVVPNGGESIHHMIGLNHMLAINESTAKKVMSLKNDELKFALRGFGLSEKELNSAAKRLGMLRRAISDSKIQFEHADADEARFQPDLIRIVPDADWANMSEQDIKLLDKHSAPGHPSNLFARAMDQVKAMPQTLAKQEKEKRILAASVAIGERNRALEGAPKREAEKCDDLLGQMDRATNRSIFHLHWGTSDNFENMRRALERYKEYQEQVARRIKDANSPENEGKIYDNAVMVNDLDRMADLSRDIAEAADTYIQGKSPDDLKNPYTRQRVELAKTIRAFGQAGQEPAEAEKDAARQNERRAQDDFNRKMESMEQQAEEADHGQLIGPGI